MHHVFNNGTFNDGGRTFGSIVQQLPNRSHRVRITPLRNLLIFNGNETVELDYKSLHPRLLYNKFKNILCPEGVYKGFRNKDMIKSAFLVLLNCIDNNEKRNKTILAIRDKLRSDGFTSRDGLTDKHIKEIISFIKEKHPKISEWIGSGVALKLMNLDQKIMQDILKNLTRQNIFTRPVHDSVIVEKQYESILHEQMMNSYYKYVGW